MSNAAVDQIAAQLAGAKVFGDYLYLNKKFGKYRLECQSTKVTDKGKPCFEFKVISSKKTHDNEPFQPGDVVSYIEDLSDPRAGGAGRMMKALLALRDMTEADIATAEFERDGKTVIAEGENAKRIWIGKMLNAAKQPCVFLQVDCEIEPRPVAAKGDKPAAIFSKERWSVAPLTEAELAAIEAKRAAAKLPNLTDAMK